MKILYTFRIALIILFSTFVMVSCNDDNPINTGKITLQAKSTLNNLANKSKESAKSQDEIVITSFKVNIKDIEFEMDDENDDNNENDDEGENENENQDKELSDIKITGPFELDLTTGNTTINFTSVEIPNDVYEEIEFDLSINTDSGSEMFGKSIEIKGNINGSPFIFWHNTEEEFEIDFNEGLGDIVVDGNNVILTIDFDLNAIFGIDSTINFSNALDTDGDGTIEINPNNDDGNEELADYIIELLEDGTSLNDDENEDED